MKKSLKILLLNDMEPTIAKVSFFNHSQGLSLKII